MIINTKDLMLDALPDTSPLLSGRGTCKAQEYAKLVPTSAYKFYVGRRNWSYLKVLLAVQMQDRR